MAANYSMILGLKERSRAKKQIKNQGSTHNKSRYSGESGSMQSNGKQVYYYPLEAVSKINLVSLMELSVAALGNT
ncbi:hypothetical protein ACU8KH_00244 [Lachancea thermotolerans]